VLSVGRNLDPGDLGPIPSDTIVVRIAPQIELLKPAALCITHAGWSQNGRCSGNFVKENMRTSQPESAPAKSSPSLHPVSLKELLSRIIVLSAIRFGVECPDFLTNGLRSLPVPMQGPLGWSSL